MPSILNNNHSPTAAQSEFAAATTTTGGLGEQRIFPGIMHERIRKECGEEDGGGGVGSNGYGYDYSSGEGDEGGKKIRKPEWGVDEMDED